MAKRNTDWEQVKIDYITHKEMSLRAICRKYNLAWGTLGKHSREENWPELKKDYLNQVVTKAVTKAVTREADKLSKLIEASDNLTGVLLDATTDDKQFYRQFVPETYKDGDSMSTVYVDKVSAKLDARALKDTVSSLKLLEDIQRSLNNLKRAAELNKAKREDEKLKLERDKFEWDKDKYSESQTTDNEVKVIIEGYEPGWEE